MTMYVCVHAGASSYSDALLGQGNGPIFFNDVNCVGSEASLVNCTSDPIGVTDPCTHADDAGVRCRSSKLTDLLRDIVKWIMVQCYIQCFSVELFCFYIACRRFTNNTRHSVPAIGHTPTTMGRATHTCTRIHTRMHIITPTFTPTSTCTCINTHYTQQQILYMHNKHNTT